MQLIGSQQGVVDPLDHRRHRISRIQGLVGIHLAGQIRITRDLPTREVDCAQAGSHLLHGLVTGQGPQGIGEVVLVQIAPKLLGT